MAATAEVIGTPRNDAIVPGTPSPSRPLRTSDAAELIFGGDGNDFVDAGGGDDTALGGNGNDRLAGGEGNDTLLGGAGDDSLDGGAGVNLLDGGEGNDLLVLRLLAPGAVYLGGDGFDTALATRGNATFGLGEVISGVERLVTAGLAVTAPVSVLAGFESIRPGLGNPSPASSVSLRLSEGGVLDLSQALVALPAAFSVAARLLGSAGADNVTLGGANDSASGGEGDDVLRGLAGNDILNGDAGDDALHGGAGNDTLRGGSGNDSLDGGDGDDRLESGAPADPLLPTREVLLGGAGDDRIRLDAALLAPGSTVDGGAGFDTLEILRSGTDLGRIDALAGVERLVTNGLAVWGTAEIFGRFDVIRPNGSATATTGTVDLRLSAPGVVDLAAATTILPPGAGGQAVGAIRMRFTGSAGADVVTLGNGNDVASGLGGDDVFYGLAGNDTLTGGAGNDLLDGGEGDDSAVGGEGDDLLFGGVGNDLLSGGLGNDAALYGFDYDAASVQVTRASNSTTISSGEGADRLLSVETARFANGVLFLNEPTLRFEEFARLSLSGPAGPVAEGTAGLDGPADVTFVVSRSGGHTGLAARVGYTVLGAGDAPADADDFDTAGGAPLSGVVEFAAGQAEATVTLRLRGDSLREAEEAFRFVLSDASGALLDGPASVEVTVRNDDASFAVAATSAAQADGALGTATPFVFTVTRAGALDRAQTVRWGVEGAGPNPATAGDFAGGAWPGGEIVFAPGEDSATLTVLVAGDYRREAEKGFAVLLSDPSPGASIVLARAEGTILDDDASVLLLTDGNDRWTGTALSDTVDGAAGNDALRGAGGNDVLVGGEGNDFLDGGLGADAMFGGDGNDTYVVDSAGDAVREFEGEGVDTVQTSLAHALAANVENLVLTGRAAVDGTGNALANALAGNAAANTLRGGEGDDLLRGGGGDDALHGDGGNDSLDGGLGADAMSGGAGDDTYVVDSAGDAVAELEGEGVDTVRASVTHELGAGVENLVLTGTLALDGTGNALANAMTGNAAANTLRGGEGNDTLDGGGGADELRGGAGDDRYILDSLGDTVAEFEGEGLDTVVASVNFALGDHVENLTLAGRAVEGRGNGLDNLLVGNSVANRLWGEGGNDRLLGAGGNDSLDGGEGNDSLLGNAGSDVLAGGAGNDVLIGGGGADSLAGDAGNDLFVLLRPAEGGDRIRDFVRGEDRLVLVQENFAGLAEGELPAAQFRTGLSASGQGPQLIYNPNTGRLLWDVDGAGGQRSVLLATLTTPPVGFDHSDIAVARGDLFGLV